MNINKTNTKSFNGYTNIKTKIPAILNSLEELDYNHLRQTKNPTCRYSHVAQGNAGQDGFFQGVLQDGEDVKKPLKYFNFGEKFIVEKFEDLEKLPALKTYMPKLKAYYNAIVGNKA